MCGNATGTNCRGLTDSERQDPMLPSRRAARGPVALPAPRESSGEAVFRQEVCGDVARILLADDHPLEQSRERLRVQVG